MTRFPDPFPLLTQPALQAGEVLRQRQRTVIDFARAGIDSVAAERSRALMQRLQDEIQTGIEGMARRRRDQVEAHVERHREAIESLRERGIDVWLEEGPTTFESEREGDQWTMRATSTVRIRWTGDGQ